MSQVKHILKLKRNEKYKHFPFVTEYIYKFLYKHRNVNTDTDISLIYRLRFQNLWLTNLFQVKKIFCS